MIEIKDKEKCCGCTACASACPVGCITMEADEEGFLYPRVDPNACIGCNLCEKVCPITNRTGEEEFYQQAFVLQARDKELLQDSTSGAAFSLLARQMFSKGGSVYGVGYDDDGMPAHKCANDEDALAEMRGSKYVQSDLLGVFSEIKRKLDRGEQILFSGLPCQIEGLLAFLGGAKPAGLVLVDLVCHSVGSPLVFNLYKQTISQDGYVRFKDKRPYGYQYSQISFTDHDGDVQYRSGVESDVYMRSFFSNINVRPSCYECVFKKRYRVADITIWDCYNAHSFCQDIDDNLGASSVLCHSVAGLEMVLKLEGEAILQPTDVDELLCREWAFTQSVKKPEDRDRFFRDCAEIDDPEALFNKWFPVTGKVIVERTVRRALSRFGLLGKFKNFVKGLAR